MSLETLINSELQWFRDHAGLTADIKLSIDAYAAYLCAEDGGHSLCILESHSAVIRRMIAGWLVTRGFLPVPWPLPEAVTEPRIPVAHVDGYTPEGGEHRYRPQEEWQQSYYGVRT